MATSFLMADRNPQDHGGQVHHDHEGCQPKRRSSGRRKIKGSDCSSTTSPSGQRKNKLPQRGMGVEKLEKLMLQERWKKMAQNVPVPDPIPKLGGFGAPSFGAYMGFQYGQVGLFGLGNPGFSKDQTFGHCNACHNKKKKFNGGNCGFLGLNNIGEYQNVTRQENHQGLNFGTKMPQGHVVAVHRKGSSSSSEGVMMEYEFFPSCSKSDSQIDVVDDDDELVMMNFAETPSSVPCVDLSLKLSY